MTTQPKRDTSKLQTGPSGKGLILPPGKLQPAEGELLASRSQPDLPTSTTPPAESSASPSSTPAGNLKTFPQMSDGPPTTPAPQSGLLVKRLHPEAPLPSKPFSTSAGWDLSYWERTESGRQSRAQVAPHAASRPLGTGLVVVPPAGHVILVLSRSGLATKGVFVANAPGLVDPDYTGELKIILYNGSYQAANFMSGDRIAQLLVVPFSSVNFVEIDTVPQVGARGPAGFGSSGL